MHQFLICTAGRKIYEIRKTRLHANQTSGLVLAWWRWGGRRETVSRDFRCGGFYPILKNFQVPPALEVEVCTCSPTTYGQRPTAYDAKSRTFRNSLTPTGSQLNSNPSSQSRIVSLSRVCVFGLAVLRVSCLMKLLVGGQRNGLLSLAFPRPL